MVEISSSDTPRPVEHSEPPRYAWLVALIAIVLLLCGMAALELANRQVIVKAIGRAPARWDDPQVRAYLATWDLDPREFLPGREKALLAVAKMRPDGDVTAHVWWELSLGAVERERSADRLRYAQKALQTAPDDSPRLSAYFGVWAREQAKTSNPEAVVGVALQAVRRAPDPSVRQRIAAAAVRGLTSAGKTKQAAELDREVAAGYGEIANAVVYRRSKARLLAKTGREAEARVILEQLVATGDETQRELARAELKELQGGEAR